MRLTGKAVKIKTSVVSVPTAGENILNPRCKCANDFRVVLARKAEYAQFKKILNKGRHPAFIGRGSFTHNANNGGALFYEYENKIIAVSLVNPRLGILLALNVVPEHRGHGLGGAILGFLIPNFARVIESKIKWFAARGYISIGKLKQGVCLKTQVMVRKKMLNLAGNISKVWGKNILISKKRGQNDKNNKTN